MTLRSWLILVILSLAFNAEVLAWAVRHGQFSHNESARSLPLRRRRSAGGRSRPVGLTLLLLGLAAMTAVWANGIVGLVRAAFAP